MVSYNTMYKRYLLQHNKEILWQQFLVVNIPGSLHVYSGMIKNDYIIIIKAFVLKEKHFVQINKS